MRLVKLSGSVIEMSFKLIGLQLIVLTPMAKVQQTMRCAMRAVETLSGPQHASTAKVKIRVMNYIDFNCIYHGSKYSVFYVN